MTTKITVTLTRKLCMVLYFGETYGKSNICLQFKRKLLESRQADLNLFENLDLPITLFFGTPMFCVLCYLFVHISVNHNYDTKK